MRAIILAMLLAGCTGLDVKPDTGNPVAVAECPEALSPITGDTFGDVVTKAIEWANQYHRCRKAAVQR